jgi:hypothetical protein
MRVEQKLALARESDEPTDLIIALKEEIEVFKSRPLLLGQQLAAVERLSALKQKKRAQFRLEQTKELITGMKSEIQFLKDTLDGDEK